MPAKESKESKQAAERTWKNYFDGQQSLQQVKNPYSLVKEAKSEINILKLQIGMLNTPCLMRIWHLESVKVVRDAKK